jgi:hypothetical protein
MSPELTAVLEPFVRRGLFPNAESAATEMARDYVLHQVQRYRAIDLDFQARHGMTYEQFDAYLRARAAILIENPSPVLSQAVMTEEEDALEWKIAREMMEGWLGLQHEALQ